MAENHEVLSVSSTIRCCIKVAIVAALYVVLTYVSATIGLAYFPIQVRFSEALCILPIFMPEAVVGLSIGCFISNMTSPFGLVDMIFGTLATFIAAFFTRKLRNIRIKDFPVVAFLSPVIINPVVVSLIITFLSPEGFSINSFMVCFASIAAGEFLACYGLGTLLYFSLKKMDIFKKFFCKE